MFNISEWKPSYLFFSNFLSLETYTCIFYPTLCQKIPLKVSQWAFKTSELVSAVCLQITQASEKKPKKRNARCHLKLTTSASIPQVVSLLPFIYSFHLTFLMSSCAHGSASPRRTPVCFACFFKAQIAACARTFSCWDKACWTALVPRSSS